MQGKIGKQELDNEVNSLLTKGSVLYVTDSGTANSKVVTLDHAPSSYYEGMGIAFKNKVQNTGSVTIDVNELGPKKIVKSNGNPLSSGNLKENGVYTVRFNGTDFFLQGEGAEYGTATPSQVLAGHTIVTETGVQNGSMPNRGAVIGYVNANESYVIQAGYHDGSGVVKGSNLASQTSADATAGDIASGKTAWVNGVKVTGTASVARPEISGVVEKLGPLEEVSIPIPFLPNMVVGEWSSDALYARRFSTGIYNRSYAYVYFSDDTGDVAQLRMSISTTHLTFKNTSYGNSGETYENVKWTVFG